MGCVDPVLGGAQRAGCGVCLGGGKKNGILYISTSRSSSCVSELKILARRETNVHV